MLGKYICIGALVSYLETDNGDLNDGDGDQEQ